MLGLWLSRHSGLLTQPAPVQEETQVQEASGQAAVWLQAAAALEALQSSWQAQAAADQRIAAEVRSHDFSMISQRQ